MGTIFLQPKQEEKELPSTEDEDTQDTILGDSEQENSQDRHCDDSQDASIQYRSDSREMSPTRVNGKKKRRDGLSSAASTCSEESRSEFSIDVAG